MMSMSSSQRPRAAFARGLGLPKARACLLTGVVCSVAVVSGSANQPILHCNPDGHFVIINNRRDSWDIAAGNLSSERGLLVPGKPVLALTAKLSADLAQSLDCTHRPLAERFSRFGVRQIELDVFVDPTGLFAEPIRAKMASNSWPRPT
jgi:hypothetical protein